MRVMGVADQDSVSPREAEVLALLSAHLSNAQIASRLHISVRTVENHVSSLLRKYAAADRRALAIAAMGSAPAVPAQPAVPPGQQTGTPSWHTTFVGRAHERDTVLAMLGSARLLTLTGPGGVGKTRLAAVIADAAAPSFQQGVAFVDLVPARHGQVIQAIATALNVTERTGQPLDQAVIGRLGRGGRLMILDNCEHVVDAVARFAARVLASCPGTTVLATSRERLGVPGERVMPVSPLPLASDAEALFADRAAAADPGFTADAATVASICTQLDGMPLAIELAAARCVSLGASGLLAALDDILRALTGGRGLDERHRSVRAVIGWSHDLLSDEERILFRRLATFAGSFDIDAAAVIAAGERGEVADLLGRLADRSLVGYMRAEGRWRLLETVRAFAAEQLAASGDLDQVQDRHLRWAAGIAARLQERLRERLDESWRAEFDAVAGDLRAALARCPPDPGGVPHRLARALGYLTYGRRFLTEARDHFTDAAARAPAPIEAAAGLRTAAQSVYAIGLAGRAFDLLLASAMRARQANDSTAEAIALADAVVIGGRFTSGFPEPVPPGQLGQLLARATASAGEPQMPDVAARLRLAAAAANIRQDPATRDPSLAEAAASAARATGDPVLISSGLDILAAVKAMDGEFRRANQLSTERLALLDQMNRSQPYCAAEVLSTLHGVWLSAFAVGDLPETLHLARMYANDDLLGAHPYRPASKMILPLALMGRFDEVQHLAEPMWDSWRRSGTPVAVWLSAAASAAALACGLLGDNAGFRRWRARAQQALGPRAGDPAFAWHIAAFAAFADARVAVHTGGVGDPSALVRHAFAAATRGWLQAYAHAAAAELAVTAGLPDAGATVAAAAPAAHQNDWAAGCLARASGRLHHETSSLERSVKLWQHIEARFEHERTLELLGAPDR
jgi:predicted ATPase/DNA-binding CsgD family transcriptional regulator